MKLLHQGLLTLLISLFILSSCKVSNTDLSVDTGNYVTGNLVDTFQVFTKTVKDTAALTGGLSLYPLGYIIDPVMGNTDASVSASLAVPYASYTFGKNAVLDSAVLVLGLAKGTFYGDSTLTTYEISVNPLTNKLSSDNNYLSSKEHAYNATVLGKYIGKINPNTPVKYLNVVTGAADTIATSFPQIRIPLDKAMIQQLFVNADTTNYATQQAMEDYFAGLHISVKKGTTAGQFGMFFLDLTGASTAVYSGIEMVYKKNSSTTVGVRDTIKTVFPISITSSNIAATVNHDYQGSALATAFTKGFSASNQVFLQPMAGTKAQVIIPYIDKLKALGKLVVNKAELVLDVDAGTEVAPFTPTSQIFLFVKDNAGQNQLIADGSFISYGNGSYGSNPAFGGIYDSTKKRYVFSVTAFMQQVLNGTISYNALYLGHYYAGTAYNSAGNVTGSRVLPTFSTANRVILAPFKGDASKMKLNIYYTKVN